MTRNRKLDPALERTFWIAFAVVTALGVLWGLPGVRFLP